jgi:hypothetical protein
LDGLSGILCLLASGAILHELSVELPTGGVCASCFVGLRVRADFDFEGVLQNMNERINQAHHCAILVDNRL